MEVKLSDAKKKNLLVVKINGGNNLLKRLSSMGIYEGVNIEKLISYRRGPVIIKVLNSQLAIGRGMAEKIIVEEL